MVEALELNRGVVHPWLCDTFLHLSVRHYAPFFDDAMYHIWARLGLPVAACQRLYGVHLVTASATTTFEQELRAGDLVVVTGRITRVGTKSVTIRLEMHNAESGAFHAAYDATQVVFDPETRASAPMPDDMRKAVEDALPDDAR